MKYLRPSFFIIGVNKCGTSSLYRYLIAHPMVLPCAEKEPNFFGQHSPEYIASHIDEYYCLFPMREYSGDLSFQWEASDLAGATSPVAVHVKREPGKHYITGEASANTFYDVPAALLHEYLPDVKLILLMRNPVERAHSHHRMYRRFQEQGAIPGYEVKDFETDIQNELEAAYRNEPTRYLSHGIYIDLLREWVSVYGWEQLKVVPSDEIAEPSRASRTMREMERYLELPPHDYGDILARHFNHAHPSDMDATVRARLADFYRPYNRLLEEFLGYKLHWD